MRRSGTIIPMRLLKLTILATAVIGYIGCKKIDVPSGTAKDAGCFSAASVQNGQAIEGQYIVSYKSTPATANLSDEQIKQKVRALILGGKINSSDIEGTFKSAGGGFVDA